MAPGEGLTCRTQLCYHGDNVAAHRPVLYGGHPGVRAPGCLAAQERVARAYCLSHLLVPHTWPRPPPPSYQEVHLRIVLNPPWKLTHASPASDTVFGHEEFVAVRLFRSVRVAELPLRLSDTSSCSSRPFVPFRCSIRLIVVHFMVITNTQQTDNSRSEGEGYG